MREVCKLFYNFFSIPLELNLLLIKWNLIQQEENAFPVILYDGNFSPLKILGWQHTAQTNEKSKDVICMYLLIYLKPCLQSLKLIWLKNWLNVPFDYLRY